MAAGQGFASLSKERRKQVSKAGAERAKQLGTKHKWTSEEAKAASAKGAKTRRINQIRKAAIKLVKSGMAKEDVYAMTDEQILDAAKKV